MATVIVGLLVLVALFFAIKGVLKHWRGESSCCGGDEITADIAMTREISDEEIFKALAGSDYKITAIHHD